MSQDWVADLYTTGTVGDTTLSNMELMFATLRSSFAGGSAPSNPVDGNLYYDSSSKKLLKVYRDAEWVGVLCGSISFKLWVYLNAAEDGWVVDGSLVDRVLAIKGGSDAYNVNGGNPAGTWQISGISVPTHPDHNHSMQSHDHDLETESSGSDQGYPAYTGAIQVGGIWYIGSISTNGGSSYNIMDKIRLNSTGPSVANTGNQSVTLSHSPSHDAHWRPEAAVGTLQRPNV